MLDLSQGWKTLIFNNVRSAKQQSLRSAGAKTIFPTSMDKTLQYSAVFCVLKNTFDTFRRGDYIPPIQYS